MTTSILSTRPRLAVIAVTLITSLVVVNLQITTKQRIITEGATILLELAPRDPRSLLQGDYMALRYAIADEVAAAAKEMGVSDGTIVVELDEHGVARFVALSGDQPTAANQHLLQFPSAARPCALQVMRTFSRKASGTFTATRNSASCAPTTLAIQFWSACETDNEHRWGRP